MARVYTRTGDQGSTSLWDGTRVAKDDTRIKLNGALDEAQAAAGAARSMAPDLLKCEIEEVQKTLYQFMTYVARGKREIEEPDPSDLEKWIDRIEKSYPHGASFVLPGESPAGSLLHLGRTILRRAERISLMALKEDLIGNRSFAFLNRLSDLVFSLACACDSEHLVAEITGIVIRELEGGNPDMKCIDLENANALIEIAKEKAKEIGVPMVIAVCDPAARLVALERMDNALLVSIGLAPKKARTAVELKNSTRELAPLVQPGAPLYGLASDSDLCFFAGGVPVRDEEGNIVAGLGISGGTVEEDEKVAQATLLAFNK